MAIEAGFFCENKLMTLVVILIKDITHEIFK